jgi:RNA ligase
MSINLKEINKKDFNISERELPDYGKVFLITPSFDKHKWLQNEFHLRSLLCDQNGIVLSSGFGKFLNYGEDPDLDILTQKSILAGKVQFSEKVDGSLIIRSVINGKVHFRTRGSHHLADDFSEPVMSLIKYKYPKLLNPSMDSRYSILFEYTSPDNRIVLKYDEPKLTAIGLMDLSGDIPEVCASQELAQQLEEDYDTPSVKFYNLGNSINDIISNIRKWKDSEGVVAWCTLPDGSMHFAKIKAAEYIRIHSLKYHLTKDKVIMLCYTKDIDLLVKLQDEMHELGIDWEAVSFIQPYFEEYIERKLRIEKEVIQFINEVEEQKVSELHSRKEMAITLQNIAAGNSGLFNIGIQYVLGDKSVVKKGMDALILNISMRGLENYKAEAAGLTLLLSKNTNSKEDRDVYSKSGKC